VPELDRASLATFQAELAASEQEATGSAQAPASGSAPSTDSTVSAGVETLEHWMAQETRICTRETAMRAASGKDFSSLIGVLDAALSHKKSGSDATTAGKRSAADASSEPAKRARTGGVPIIIVPSALTSLITMHNAHAFLQKGQWLPPSATTAAPKTVFIERPSIFDDTKTVKYEVIDSANDLKSEDWYAVDLLFCQ
jgi:parafibromin